MLHNNSSLDHIFKRSDRVNVNTSSNFTPTERLESLKAGIVAGLSTGLMFVVLTGVNQFVLFPEELFRIETWVISVAIAGLSGFLFGVTFRYAIRNDQNPQLKLGVVFAFGLVRGLTEVDGRLKNSSEIFPSLIVGVESLVLFGVAGLVLNWAIQQGWVKSFSSGS